MDLLTVKEVAELKGCYFTYVQRLIQSGKLAAETVTNEKNRKMYMVPVSALPEELQEKYYRQQRIASGLEPELKTAKKERKNTVLKPFEAFSEDERKEILLWQDILREWQIVRERYDRKTEADALFVAKCKLEHPEISISEDILYRKHAANKHGDLEGLVDNRGGWNKGMSTIPEPAWNAFQWFWLDENGPTTAECYRDTVKWMQEFYPELVAELPTERSFRRRIASIPTPQITYMRGGDKAYKDEQLAHIVRMYDTLHSNDCWIADNHTLDVHSFGSEGQRHRLYVTAFSDAKSGVITGWNITENPSVHSTILALRHGIKRFGCPKSILTDNGMEFLVSDFGGRIHRKHSDKPQPPTILKRLGIEIRAALPRRPQSKPIERVFLTLKNQFSRALSGFCGGNVIEKPECLTRRIKQGKLPQDYEIREVLAAWIDGDYNVQSYGGMEARYKDMSRVDVWNASIKDTVMRQVDESTLNLMMMRSTGYQKVGRNGVYVNIVGEKLWYYDMEQAYQLAGKEVYVRYDPAALGSVRIYDTEDKFLCEWQLADYLYLDFLESDSQAIADAEEAKNKAYKFVREQARGISAALTEEQRISRLDMLLRRANNNKFNIEPPDNVVSIVPPEKEGLQKAAGAEYDDTTVDLSRMADNALKRLRKDEN